MILVYKPEHKQRAKYSVSYLSNCIKVPKLFIIPFCFDLPSTIIMVAKNYIRLFPANWRASVASETLTGVTQSKIGDVYLLASERSERDTYRGNTIENRGCLFIYLDICLDVCMSFCTLTLRIFVFVPRSTPSQTSLNRILGFSDHYPYHLRN